MKKQYKWEIFWGMIAVGLLVMAIGITIGLVINSIDLSPHQIYTFEGEQYDCKFPAPDVMECEQIGDPNVGFGRE